MGVWAAVIGVLLTLATSARGQAPYDNETVATVLKSPDAKTPGTTSAPPTDHGLETVLRMMLWLAVVVVFIYVAVWLIRKYVPSARGMFGAGVVKVVGRATVGTRQHLLLVKVGGRFVLVGVTATTMTPLTEITDPEEARALMEALAEQSGGKIASSFKSAMSKADSEMAPPPDGTPGDAGRPADVREVREELDAVRKKVNWWRGQTKS